MKRIVLIFFFFIGFSSYGQSQQDTSFFEISTLDGAAFLDPKLPQRPADSIKCCNNYLAYDEEYMEETFFSKIDSIAKELGIYEQLMDRNVYMDFYFNKQGSVFYCDFHFLSIEYVSQIGLKKLEEFVKRMLTLKIDMQYVHICYEILPYHGLQDFTYGCFTARFVKKKQSK
jgi:hypothetical protein